MTSPGGFAESATTAAGSRSGARGLVLRFTDLAIALTALLALAASLAGAFAPRLGADVDPAAVTSDGGHAFTFSPGFRIRWPYTVPSHPRFVLTRGDVAVLENGRPIGGTEPSHGRIRDQGDGLFNFWESTLWFSASDGSDPRSNGRTYRLEVRTRLGPEAAGIRQWSLILLVVLVLTRLVLPLGPDVARVARHGSAALLRGAGRLVGAVEVPARAVAARVPLTFGRTYALVVALLLGAFAVGTLVRPAPLFTQPDSLGYVLPGLQWAAGHDVTGQSLRDLGYPALTVLSVRLGSLATLPRIQLLIVAAGIACLLGAYYVPLRAMADRLQRQAAVPLWLSAIAAAAAGAALVAVLANHDLFVIDIESAMAEGPHVLPTALALLLFLGGWTAKQGSSKIACLAWAALAAYASAMFKPHTLLVAALCVAGFAVVAARHWRAFRSPGLVATCALAAALAAGMNRLDAWVTPQGTDFGPRILFCNHLDVIEPVFDGSTPEREHVSRLMREAMSRVDGWPLMGYAGDGCIYNEEFTAAIRAAAQVDGRPRAQWEQREFLLGVIRNPLRYLGDVARQVTFFMLHPVANVDFADRSQRTDADLAALAPYADLINMGRSQWTAEVTNWVPAAHPWIGGTAKAGLIAIGDGFAPVTLLATALAVVVLLARRFRDDPGPEVCVVASACFCGAFVAVVALTHSFDVGRYVTDILPVSLLWWFISAVYLVQLAIVAAAAIPGWLRDLRPSMGSPRRAGEA